jgi:fructose-specific phosphotransferase system IIA component
VHHQSISIIGHLTSVIHLTNQELLISDVIRPETVELELSGITDKEGLLKHLVSLLYKAGKILSEETFLEAIYEREAMGPTFMENFIAIPHGKSDTVVGAAVAFARSHEGIMYETPLGSGLAKLIFMLAIPNTMGPNQYVRVLARLARMLVHDPFREALYNASSHDDVINAIINGERLIST